MNVTPLPLPAAPVTGEVDAPLLDDAPLRAGASSGGSAFGDFLGTARAALDSAAGEEDAFARGAGNLTTMAVARAQADVAVAIAAAGTQRAVQALSTVFGMQV